MNLKLRSYCLFYLFLICEPTRFSFARLLYLNPVSDGMVLQRNTKVNIWGRASPLEKVTIRFKNNIYSTTTGADGKWKIILPSMKEGGPYTMRIDASNHLVLNNIVIGDVWICSGQSNMTITMERVKEKYPEEIAASENKFIRHYFLSTRYNFTNPEEDTSPAKWESANPTTVLQFTAIGYFFAKKLYEKYHVPIGLIQSAVGGTPVESWMSEDALKKFPDYLASAQKFKDKSFVDSLGKAEYNINNAWNNQVKSK